MDNAAEERTGSARTAEGLVAPRTPAHSLLGWWPAGLAVIGVLVATYLVLRPAGSGSGLVGKAAPDFTLTTVTGQTVHLAALRGHPVLLNFWGVSCPPCRHEVGLLQAAWRTNRDKGLVILGVDEQKDDGQSVAAFVSERGVTYPMLLDPSGAVGPQHYGVTDLPQSVLIDRGGIVRQVVPAPFLDPGPLGHDLAGILG
ncbi:MAG TPA: TlpA disulfide reductase family protein [Chloroflexota bacterium]|jgi:cytochrome c biogenesis protein CcmG/thiol:disulfide interchange protein DsbE